MNAREHIRQHMGEEGVREYDRAQRLQSQLTEKVCTVINEFMAGAGDANGKASSLVAMGVLEGATRALATVIAATHATLSEAHPDNTASRAEFVQASVASLVANLKRAFDLHSAQRNNIADQIKAAAARVTEA